MANISEKQLWLDEETHHKLKIMATERKMTMRAFARYLLENYDGISRRNKN